ncbi:MAG TPA: potassium transporter TrkG [Myxococcota bacterium]|nr:potassium transporter TrkG [Myxococcota bacterium]
MFTPLRELGRTRGALVALSPVPLTLLGWWRHTTLPEVGLDALIPSVSAVVGFLVAAQWLMTRPRVGVIGFGVGVLGTGVTAFPPMAQSPALALVLSVIAILSAASIAASLQAPLRADAGDDGAPEHHQDPSASARGAAMSAILIWLFATLSGALTRDDPYGRYALWSSLILAFLVVARFSLSRAAWRSGHSQRRRLFVIWGASILLTVLALTHWDDSERIEHFAVGHLLLVFVVLPRRTDGVGSGFWDPIIGHPERLFVATFAALCSVGTVLLGMPASSVSGAPIPLIDAAFMSVSSVCVTGLATVDAGTNLSPLGQTILLMLIQAGGLGIMTFSTAAMRLLGRRMSLRHEGVVARIVSPQDRSQVFGSTLRLVKFTLTAELIGALALWPVFAAELGTGPGLWKAVFTAISAFCNAGFALDSTSLVGYQSEPFVLHVVALLIIAGGLAPAVVLALPRWVRSPRSVAPQARLVILVSVILLVAGFVLYLALEWRHTLSHLDLGDKLHNAWFQSVTLRTAGFNSVDYGSLQSATLMMMMLQMFIGGSPGGTAGGIKTTTAGLLILAVIAAIRGREHAQFAGRAISMKSFYKAVAVLVAAFATVTLGLVVMLLTQDMPLRSAAFEVVSAVGTVGLSIGGTAELDGIGKGVIMACMFLGRVGSLTLLMFLSQSGGERAEWKRPETEIEVA